MHQLSDIYNSTVVTVGGVLAQVPDGDAKAPGDLGAKGDTIVGAAKWVGLMICVLAMIGAGVKIATEHRHGGGDGQSASGVLKVLLAVVVVSGAASLVSFML